MQGETHDISVQILSIRTLEKFSKDFCLFFKWSAFHSKNCSLFQLYRCFVIILRLCGKAFTCILTALNSKFSPALRKWCLSPSSFCFFLWPFDTWYAEGLSGWTAGIQWWDSDFSHCFSQVLSLQDSLATVSLIITVSRGNHAGWPDKSAKVDLCVANWYSLYQGKLLILIILPTLKKSR